MRASTNQRRAQWIAVLAGCLALGGLGACSSNADSPPDNTGGAGGGGSGGDTNNVTPGQTSFESDDPRHNGQDGSRGAGKAEGSNDSDAVSPGQDGGEAERAIEEADIIQIHGGKLYALSRYSGLSVIDIGTRDELKMLGRFRTTAQPFEMIMRDNVVVAMFNAFPVYAWDEASDSWSSQQTSRILALDVADPRNIQEIGSFDVPGAISDSRVVGDIFYIVAYENGYCWRCENAPTTTVLSLDLSDPSDIQQADRLSFVDQDTKYGGYKRSISVNTQRMYVSGIEWDWSRDNGHSTIEVVDISSPTGQMYKGSSVAVAGQIESRWQMNEHEGVLRVISQAGNSWNSGTAPTVETFSVDSSHKISPIASMPMQLPRPENLQSVRFDGPRAFAVTFERTDPLFTIDLSDPEQPRQVGELEIPGWLYHMEPRGDRLLALGFDNGNENGGITVSLFDVADLAKPTMIERVNFGGEWGWMPEDQDRIHKAFKILDDKELILVPFNGWQRNVQDDYGCSRYISGIQLVDFTSDSLTLRGAATQHGQSRRAFLHDERLFAVSDQGVHTFDIADRDKPVAKAGLATAHNAIKTLSTDKHVIQVSADWWTDQAELSIFPRSDPEAHEPLGKVNLNILQNNEQQRYCYASWGFAYGSKLFAHDNYVYLVWDNGYYDYYGTGEGTTVAVIDIQDPTAPQVVSRKRFPFGFDGWGWGYYYDYREWGTAMLGSGQRVVQHGSTLVFQERERYYYYPNEDKPQTPARLHIVDLSNPTDPRLTGSIVQPQGRGYTPLLNDGAIVLSSHYEPVPDTGKALFYVDRLDVTDPSDPQVLPKVNVPGSLVAANLRAGRLVTVDYLRITTQEADYQACYEKWGSYDAYFDSNENTCTGFRRALKLLDLERNTATLLDSLVLADGHYGTPAQGDDRLMLVRHPQYYYYYDLEMTAEDRLSKLLVVSGMLSGSLKAAPEVALGHQWWSWNQVVAHGKKAVAVNRYPGSLAVYDTSDPDRAPVLEQSHELYGYYPYGIEIEGDTAICALGQWGVQAVELK